MPRHLFDLKNIDLSQTTMGIEEIEKTNPHRFEFRLLDRVIYLDTQTYCAVGIFQVRDDQFWVRGHIPGRPLFPGVLQIEATAQLCSIVAARLLSSKENGFFGFIGVDKIKFRKQVQPGDDLIILVKLLESRRLTRFTTQSLVNDQIVFSGEITGSYI